MGITSPLTLTFLIYSLVFVVSQLVIFLVGAWFTENFHHLRLVISKAKKTELDKLSQKVEKAEALEHLLFYFVLGLVGVTAAGIIFAWLNVRWLSFVLVAEGLIWGWRHRARVRDLFANSWSAFTKFSLRIKLLLLVGIFAQVIATLPSGFLSDRGATFYRLNSEDGILHLAFSETMKRSFPPLQPAADGLPITNYHYWSDFFISEVSRIFQIPVIHIYFQFIPIVLAVFLGLSILLLAKKLGGDQRVQFWVLFTHFFAGNVTFVFTQLVHGEWRWNTPAIDHGVLQFFNMPQAFARLILVTGMISLIWFIKKKEFGPGLATAVFFGVVTGFKVYFGMFAALGMSILVLAESLRLARAGQLFNTWHKKLLSVLAIQAMVAAAVFFPVNSQAGGLIFDPLFWPKIMLGQSNIEWNEWWLRMQVYEAAGNTRNVLIFRALAIAIFGVSVFGTRLLGLLILRPLIKMPYTRLFYIFSWPTSVLFMLVGINFLQVSGGANIFNFFVVALLFLGFFTGFHLANLEAWMVSAKQLPMRVVSGVVLGIFVILSVPRPLQDAGLFLRSWFEDEEAIVIPTAELVALEYLKKNGQQGSIQSSPDNIHDYRKGPYVAFFSGHNSFYAAEIILESHNQPISNRPLLVENIFDGQQNEHVSSLMDQAKIRYLYLRLDANEFPGSWIDNPPQGLNTFYKNDQVLILQRN